MSAYIVGHDHIDALLSFAIDLRVAYWVADTKKWVEIKSENATEVGRILLTENERSVRYRYGDGDDLPGTIGEDAATYKFKPWSNWMSPLAAVPILKGCNCFDYQSCETGDYRESLAFAIISSIKERAIQKIPGYDDAPGWDFTRTRKVKA